MKLFGFHFNPFAATTRAARPHVQRPPANLAEIPAGQAGQVSGFSAHLSPTRRAQLLAYGLTPGCQVRVVQHAPVTIVEIEHLELALEPDLAREVMLS